MIKVTIDLNPFGRGKDIQTLATVKISNIGGTVRKGIYYYEISYMADGERVSGEIKDWSRMTNNVVQLLAAVLKDADL